MSALASRVIGWTRTTKRVLMVTVASGLALVALGAASVSVPIVSAHASTTHITHITHITRTMRAASGTPAHEIPAHVPSMYCNMPNAPKATWVRSATRAEVEADVAKFQGKAAAAALGSNFILASPTDIVQGTTCYGGYNANSDIWGGDIANEYGSPSSAKAYGAFGEYRLRSASGQDLGSWTGIGGVDSGSDVVQDGVNQTRTSDNLWYEFYPNPPVYLTGHTAAPNDLLYTDVSETSTTSHYYQVFIEDMSSSPMFMYDNYFTFNENSGTHDSAEWITELPDAYGTIPYFQGVTFTNGYWSNTSGNSVNITGAYNLGDIQLTALGITNCIRVSNQTSNGLQTNWITDSSCPY